ncbi:MAG: geranylgeranyl reductase family protein [Pseudomonadota bacterium]
MAARVDILVVGGGPAGGAAAAEAARAGAGVVLVEAKRRLGERPHCAEWVPRLLAREVEFPERCVVQTTSNMVTIGPGFEASTPAPGFILDRGRFDHGLGEQAAGAGADIRCGARLVAWDQGAATLKGPWGLEKIRADLVIAADGAASTVRRLMGLKAPRRLTGVGVEVPLVRPLDDTQVHFNPRWRHGYAWLFPKGPVANLGLGLLEIRPGEAREALEDFRLEMIRREVIRPGCLGRSVGAIAVDGPEKSLIHDRVILTGDAAGLTHPITGAGIPQAVISGREAGRAAAAFIDQGDQAVLSAHDGNILDLYGATLAWGLGKRRHLENNWTSEPFPDLIAGTWPAFRKYRENYHGRGRGA